MKKYIQFYNVQKTTWNKSKNKLEKLKPENYYFVEPCGTDAVFTLDGRNNLDTMIQDGYNQAHRLRNVQSYDAFKVMQGDNFRDAGYPLTEFIGLSND